MTVAVRLRRRLVTALVGIAALALAACGLPEDSSPRVISEEALPPDLTDGPAATTTIPPELAEDRQVFLVKQLADDQYRLEPVPRQVRADATTEAKIASTLESLVRRPGGDDPALGTRVPETLLIQGVTLTDNTLTIDLSADMASVENISQRLAFAQLVFTATQFDEVDNVRFTIDGDEQNAVDGTGGAVPLVTRASYANFAPESG
jgi:spore germination protein GerM